MMIVLIMSAETIQNNFGSAIGQAGDYVEDMHELLVGRFSNAFNPAKQDQVDANMLVKRKELLILKTVVAYAPLTVNMSIKL